MYQYVYAINIYIYIYIYIYNIHKPTTDMHLWSSAALKPSPLMAFILGTCAVQLLALILNSSASPNISAGSIPDQKLCLWMYIV